MDEADASRRKARNVSRPWTGASRAPSPRCGVYKAARHSCGHGHAPRRRARSLEKRARPGDWKSVLASVRGRTEEGMPLSEAMGEQPLYFDGVCRSLIAAGEAGGKLEVLLDHLASLTRQQLKVRTAVVGALTYPTASDGDRWSGGDFDDRLRAPSV